MIDTLMNTLEITYSNASNINWQRARWAVLIGGLTLILIGQIIKSR
jgi:hypothetical protein